jgi:ArsR family transcriptional regulator
MIKKRQIEQHKSLALKFKALAHPARLEIIRLLKERPFICAEIVDELPLAQATVSQHLKVLKEAGFILSDNSGVSVCYSLNKESLEMFKTRLFNL